MWIVPLFVAVFGAVLAAVGTGLVGSSWIAPEGLIGGGVALVLAATVVRSSLDALVVATPFMFLTLSPVGGIFTVGTSDLVLPFVVVALVIRAALEPWSPTSRSGVPGAGALFVTAVVLASGSTTIWAVASSDFLFPRALSDTMKLTAGVSYLVVVFLLVRRGGPTSALHAFQVWVWTATALALGSVVGATGVIEIIPSDGYRSLGYFLDPNLYAGYLLLSLSVVLFLAVVSPSVWRSAQAVLLIGAVVTTGSRGGLVSLVLLVTFAALMINSARARTLVLGVTAVVSAAGFFVLEVRDTGTQFLGVDRLFFAAARVEEDPRLELWGLAVSLWSDHPLFGIGLGQFERYTVGIGGRSGDVGYVAHNSFLYFLVALGVGGLLLFVSLLVWLLVRLHRSAAVSRAGQTALASGFVVIISQMMTLDLQNLRYVWVYFGLVLGVSMLDRSVGSDAGAASGPHLQRAEGHDPSSTWASPNVRSAD